MSRAFICIHGISWVMFINFEIMISVVGGLSVIKLQLTSNNSCISCYVIPSFL